MTIEGGKLAIMTGCTAALILLAMQEPGLALVWGPIVALVTVAACVAYLFISPVE